MATPIIYTGKGAVQPLSTGGQSLQALGQFSQQQQQLNRDKLSKTIKDRDMILEAMKIDPVYSASTKARENMASEMEGYVQWFGDLAREKQGSLSYEDWGKINQRKASIMAEQSYHSDVMKEMQQASAAIKNNPTKYDFDDYTEAVQYYDKTGIRPEGGFLQPAYQDPAEYWAEGRGFTKVTENVNPRKDPNTGLTVYDKREVVMVGGEDGQLREATNEDFGKKGVLDFRTNPTIQVNTIKRYDKLFKDDADAAKYYANKASNLDLKSPYEAYAYEVAVDASPKSTSGVNLRGSTSNDDKTSFSWNNGFYGTKDKRYLFKETLSGESGLSDGEGYVFTEEAKKQSIEIDPSKLNLPSDVVLPDKPLISLKVSAIDKNGKVKFIIDKNSGLFREVVSDRRPKDVKDYKTESFYKKTDGSGETITEEEYQSMSSRDQKKYEYSQRYISRKPITNEFTTGNITEVGSDLSKIGFDVTDAIGMDSGTQSDSKSGNNNDVVDIGL